MLLIPVEHLDDVNKLILRVLMSLVILPSASMTLIVHDEAFKSVLEYVSDDRVGQAVSLFFFILSYQLQGTT